MDTVRISLPDEAIAAFCQRHRIRKLSLFGSVLCDDFRPDSDVDVLVEFEPEYIPGLLKFSAMQIELSEIIGRDVHLSTHNFLSDYFRQKVMDTARVQYERA